MPSKWVTAATQKESMGHKGAGSFRNIRSAKDSGTNDHDADDMKPPKKKKRDAVVAANDIMEY